MNKHSIAVACLLPALTALHLAPASAAPSAVSNVKVAWSDATRTAVKITWTSPLADTVELTTQYGPTSLGSTAAGAADQLIVPVSKFYPTHDATRSSQIVVTDSGGAMASSVAFDQYVPRARPTNVVVGAGNTLRGTATVENNADTTPGDPLDVSVPLRYTPDLLIDCVRKRYATSSSPSFTVPVPSVPALMWIDTANEWPAPRVDQGYTGFDLPKALISTTAPTSSTYRQVFTLTGVVYQLQEFYTYEQGNCGVERTSPDPRTVIIQARKDSGSLWAMVGSTKTVTVSGAGSPYPSRGVYSFKVTNPGTRQYRAVVPTIRTANSIDFGVISGARTVKATTQVLSAKFLTSTVSYGKPATAYLALAPGGSQRALLQARNTSGVWAGVTYKTLSGGKGYATITWRRRGVTAFRWYSPATQTSSGLSVGAVFTPTFYLTVR